MKKQFAKIKNGENIAYFDINSQSKKVFVAIHGNFGSAINMKSFWENLGDYRVIAPDLRGFGDSSYNNQAWKLKEYAIDIALLLEELGIKKAVVAGWSLGGGVAMELAIEAPEVVEKLILVASTPCAGYPLFKQVGENWLPFESPEELSKVPAIETHLEALKVGNVAYVRGAYDMTVFPVHKPQEEEYVEICEAAAKQRNLLEADWALATFNISHFPSLYGQGTGEVDKIACPVLLTYTKNDILVPQFSTDQNIAALGQKATIKSYEDGGHAIFFDNEKQFFADVKEFLG